MREISSETIEKTIKELFIDANYNLGKSECDLIKKAYDNESSKTGKNILEVILDNLETASNMNIPICQDTGMAIVIAEIGQNVHIVGDDFETAVNKGVSVAYTDGYMRASVVRDPLFDRKNTADNTPAIIHVKMVPGDKIKLTALPKGFGSENMSAIKMFKPSASKDDIVNFVVDTVCTAGSNPCPPIQIGIGIGGSFDYAPFLAKLALSRGVGTRNKNEDYAKLELEILSKVNEIGIGPQGFGGDTTALDVSVEYYPTHIAGLPVAVNINCHVMRHKTAVI